MAKFAEPPQTPSAGWSAERFRAVFGRAVLRPWLDGAALSLLSRWYFPLSRAWAAGLESTDADDVFFAATGASKNLASAADWAITRSHRRAATLAAATRRWDAAAFGPTPSEEALALAQASWQRAALSHMASRVGYAPLNLPRRLTPVRFSISTPDDVAARHGHRLAGPAAAWPQPSMPAVAMSPAITNGDGFRVRWLRFRSPVLGDDVTARVDEPVADDGPVGTLVMLHGVSMETEHWGDGTHPLAGLGGRTGLRIIRPEGPWHGRRRRPGWYGGEPTLAGGPAGLIDTFEAWVQEVGGLIAWARRTCGGPVGVFGVSLGSLTAQLLASAAAGWAAEYRPDGLLLVATSGAIDELSDTSSLAGALGLSEALRAAGWTAAAQTRWLSLAAPALDSPLDPARIVMLLGRADDLTPYDGGRALASAWQVPPENLFERPQGHFTVSVGLATNPEPLQRLVSILSR